MELVLMDKDLEHGKKLKKELEDLLGIKIKKLYREDTNTGDDIIKISTDKEVFSLRNGDVLFVDDEMSFEEWLNFYNRGIKVFKQNMYSELKNYLLRSGVDFGNRQDILKEFIMRRSDIKNNISGKLNVFYGAKNGHGKSTILLNTAIVKKKSGDYRVAIIDADIVYNAIKDYVISNNLSQLEIKRNLANISLYKDENGIFIYTNIGEIRYDSNYIAGILDIIDSIKNQFDIIFVNVPTLFDKGIYNILYLASNIIIITENDFISIKGLEKVLNVIKDFKYKVIVNKARNIKEKVDITNDLIIQYDTSLSNKLNMDEEIIKNLIDVIKI